MRASVHKRMRGVTLIELVIAMAVLAILLAAGMPTFSTWIQNTRTRTAANSLLQGLQLARQEAIRNNARVQFQLDGDGWTVGCATATADCPAVIQSKTKAASTPITVSDGGVGTYVFDQMGYLRVPALAAGTVSTAINVSNTALAEADSRNLRIMLTSGGLVKLCDPKVTDNTDLRFCQI